MLQRKWIFVLLSLFLFFPRLSAAPDTGPLPQDKGALRLYQLLTQLHTTARIMHTVAHPDDEDTGMLALESRGNGATVLVFTTTRGEGGQNKIGTESSDELGILRTLELLEADKYYGVEQRFSHVADFGFSKSAEETFQKWHGHDLALGDMVRVIRAFRPEVLVSRFSGTPRDGHGHHEASGILTKEAFRAAADPARFPEQIKEGLLPWQAKKLYMGANRSNDEQALRLDTGTYSPILGMSYAQFGLEGRSHQTSQGTAGQRAPAGHRYTYYRLTDSVLTANSVTGPEQDFFDGIDTSLPALVARLGEEESKVSSLRPALVSIAKHVEQATAVFSLNDPTPCAPALQRGLAEVSQVISQIEDSSLSAAAKSGLLASLREKRDQFEQAIAQALGILLEATVDSGSGGSGPSKFSLATPGDTFSLTARLYNRNQAPLTIETIRLDLPAGWKRTVLKQDLKSITPGDYASVQFQVSIPQDATFTRPYWTRRDSEIETAYSISDPQLITLPLPPYPVHATAIYATTNGKSSVSATAQVVFIDPLAGQTERPLAVGPAISVNLETPAAIIPVAGARKTRVALTVRSNASTPVHAVLGLKAPQGWRVEPASIPVDLNHEGDVSLHAFHVTPQDVRESKYEITARAEYKGKEYAEGFKVIARPDLDSFYFYHPSTQNVAAVDVKLPPQLRVGYLMGAGDEIPAILGSVGLKINQITPQELANGDLSRYDTIVLGIRAYDVRTDLREQNRRLLDYVNRGGTLIVQYNQSVSAFNEGQYTPYPTTLSTARVTVEEAPVEILVPQSPVFSYPNRISAKDFDNWVQERGLDFMSQWDDHFKPLLASHDPGEPAQKGGLLITTYGKGTYIYTGLAFFRQVPAGVPGAIRLFVNLLSAGHSPTRVRKPAG